MRQGSPPADACAFPWIPHPGPSIAMGGFSFSFTEPVRAADVRVVKSHHRPHPRHTNVIVRRGPPFDFAAFDPVAKVEFAVSRRQHFVARRRRYLVTI